MRVRLVGLLSVLVVLVLFLVWHYGSGSRTPAPSTAYIKSGPLPAAPANPSSPTLIYAHNLLLRQGLGLEVYVGWLHGHLRPARANVIPSFDEPDSFFIDIDTGVLRVDLAEVAKFLNSSGMSKTALRNVSLSGQGDQLKLTATLHKVVPLPIEITGVISPLPDGRIHLHVLKIAVVKIPVGGLLRDFHLKIEDLFDSKSISGIQVSGNDIFLDPTTLMPPPHIRGHLSTVSIINANLNEVYGKSTQNDEARVEQWRNFLRLRDGTVTLGGLTMHPVDIIMIDTSSDQWFDLDLTHYEEQLVNGYIRMTPQAGLQIFMPDLSLIPKNKANEDIGIEWMKNRNIPPPAEVSSKE